MSLQDYATFQNVCALFVILAVGDMSYALIFGHPEGEPSIYEKCKNRIWEPKEPGSDLKKYPKDDF